MKAINLALVMLVLLALLSSAVALEPMAAKPSLTPPSNNIDLTNTKQHQAASDSQPSTASSNSKNTDVKDSMGNIVKGSAIAGVISFGVNTLEDVIEGKSVG